jgi:hypothetical protein
MLMLYFAEGMLVGVGVASIGYAIGWRVFPASPTRAALVAAGLGLPVLLLRAWLMLRCT